VIIDYECLNSVLVNCIKGKRDMLDLDTLKEILKIFINLVLWRKIRRDMIHMCCYVCDIGLMIMDADINMMSIFCLSQLTENEKSHQFLIKTVNPVPKQDKSSLIEIKDARTSSFPAFEENVSSQFNVKIYGLFNRFNMLLDTYNPEDLTDAKKQQEYIQALLMNQNNHSLAENYKKELMMNLIAQTYLNLSRNEACREYLVNLRIFKKLMRLVDKYFRHE
jgi:hypothetical protein